MAQKTPINAQKTGIRLPVATGFVLRYPKKYATGYGRCRHGGEGINGFRKRSMSKFHSLYAMMTVYDGMDGGLLLQRVATAKSSPNTVDICTGEKPAKSSASAVQGQV